ncbi:MULTISPECIES: hypothetical protein [unclassified Campylobacter]|uniref:hypothetical protein n=1 Tax=unclassified Campylobacter TaxID=2593542 RepID=UPI0022E9D7FC|nr:MULTISPECIES: hypothetical protein [unclassified Campylobacter]MDA3053764.1 hypothetical protein [Campylobacter sp. VBCF_07 NA4]MDA3060347.1 hypothetical protein [Campylobacter sp. VBCF_02 NA5]MDA3069857.1 hypothetical protein [Campylobacter sp. VBCF_08 NA3]WBR54816.1 hypothetical protein PF027_02805 [Campylobacter sp. VBCF_01 NA2]
MKLAGQILNKSVILGDDGKRYSYSTFDFHDENLKIGDFVSFIAEKNKAVFIKYIKDGVSPEPQDETSFLKKEVNFEFVEIEPKQNENLESKIYSNFIRKHGILSCILPLILAGGLMFFKGEIISFLLANSANLGFVNSASLGICVELAIVFIWLLAYLIPLNLAFNGLAVATHDLYAKRQINSFNLFFILTLIVALAEMNNFFGLQKYGLGVLCVLGVLGFCEYFYKAKAFFYLSKKTGVKLFILALIVDFVAVFSANVLNRFFGFIDPDLIWWQHVAICAVIAPLYILSFLLIKRLV